MVYAIALDLVHIQYVSHFIKSHSGDICYSFRLGIHMIF